MRRLPGSHVQFRLIYTSSLFCVMASGWATTLFKGHRPASGTPAYRCSERA